MNPEEQNKVVQAWQTSAPYWDKYRALITRMFAPINTTTNTADNETCFIFVPPVGLRPPTDDRGIRGRFRPLRHVPRKKTSAKIVGYLDVSDLKSDVGGQRCPFTETGVDLKR